MAYAKVYLTGGRLVQLKPFLTGAILVYMLVSLPAMLGIGFVIDWLFGAIFAQRFKGYIVDGFVNKFSIKIIAATMIGDLTSFIISVKGKIS